MSDGLQIRQEEPADVEAVQAMLRDAFFNLYQPGADEHAIAHKLRASPDFLSDLTLVGVVDGRIVAFLLSSRASIEGHESCLVAGFGPICVDPAFQARGLGTKIVNEAILRARSLGYSALALGGHPCYYERFGFRCSKAFGISDAEGRFPRGQLLLELHPGILRGVSGVLRFSGDFEITEGEIAEVESRYDPRERFQTNSQKMFGLVIALQADDPYPPEFDPKLVWDREPLS